MVNDRRGMAARAEMRPKGYLQVKELAEKLTRETGTKVTVSSLRSYRVRGRIEGVFHEQSNLWFFKANTKLPKKLPSRRPKVAPPEPAVITGPWGALACAGVCKDGEEEFSAL